jgi:hypothetical protein
MLVHAIWAYLRVPSFPRASGARAGSREHRPGILTVAEETLRKAKDKQ